MGALLRSCLAVTAWALLGVALIASAQAEPSQHSRQLEAGRRLYEAKCAQCHGSEGDGAGVVADRFDPAPRDFTSGAFKIRTTPSGELPTDEDLARVIRNGMPYTGMPAWSSLSDDEITSVVAYIEAFNEDFSDPEMRVPQISIPQPPPLTKESVQQGREVYLANKCFDCHGSHGRGDGPSAPTLTDDWGQSIRPADLTKRWTFRGGRGRVDIYRTFTTGLNGTPMPSYEDSIEEEERWQLVDYVYSLSSEDPSYGTLVVAAPVEVQIDLDPRNPIFELAKPTRIPLVGQVTDPGRQFTPATNALEVRAVYNAERIAIQLSWHAMRAHRQGTNRPDGRDPAQPGLELSDAVAIQVPTHPMSDPTTPYFLYGDPRHSVDLWFFDAAQGNASVYLGRGEADLTLRPRDDGPDVGAAGAFEDGLWQVVFSTPRHSPQPAGEIRFAEGTFIPIAFSVWSGDAGETGNRRAVTSWQDLYLAPPDSSTPYLLGGGLALFTLVAEVFVAARVRSARSHPDRQI